MKVVLQTGKTVLPKEKQGGGGNEIQSLGTNARCYSWKKIINCITIGWNMAVANLQKGHLGVREQLKYEPKRL